MITNSENRVSSYHRSISWQITHIIKSWTTAQRVEFFKKMEMAENVNNFMGLPVNEDLKQIALNALAECEKCDAQFKQQHEVCNMEVVAVGQNKVIQYS